jgi:hypothetical protein
MVLRRIAAGVNSTGHVGQHSIQFNALAMCDPASERRV